MESESASPPSGVILPCGWGRLIFAHTFSDPSDVARILLEEKSGQRDIAFYVTDPHIILNTAPRNLFMDPSHTYRILFSNYKENPNPELPITISELSDSAGIEDINRIYHQQGMVTVAADEMESIRRDPRLRYFIAKAKEGKNVLAVALGVDHQLAFQDLENGCSLWSLAVDPQASFPGLGEAMVRHLVEFYQARGRSQLDLSVLHTNEEAIGLYAKLGFERVPVFAIKRCNPINEDLFTGRGLPEGFNPYANLLIREAARRGIDVEPINSEKGYFRLRLGGRVVSCRESLTDLTSAVAMSRCDDKEMTRETLEAAGLAFPAQRKAGIDEDEDLAFLKTHGRVVVKPARGEQGQGVFVDLKSWQEVADAIKAARAFSETVLMEQFVEGQDLRIVVINYEVVAAAIRQPAEITGTGRHTVAKLIESTSRRRAAATGGESKIPVDEETLRCIAEGDATLETILPAGKSLRVRRAANLHTGGTIHDVTAQLHPDLASAAVTAATALEIPVVGLDFIVRSPQEPEYFVIEANERPGLANHEPQPTAERFIDLLFPHTANHGKQEAQSTNSN